MKYAVKDLIYLTAIVAVLLAWGRDAWRNADRIDEMNRVEQNQREEIARLKLMLSAESNSRTYAVSHLELSPDEHTIFKQLQVWAYGRLMKDADDPSILDEYKPPQ